MASSARKISKSVHSPEHRAFRAVMVEAREKAGLTQQVLAKRLGKPQSFIAKYETGERRLDVIEFTIVSRAIGVEPARLLRALLKKAR